MHLVIFIADKRQPETNLHTRELYWVNLITREAVSRYWRCFCLFWLTEDSCRTEILGWIPAYCPCLFSSFTKEEGEKKNELSTSSNCVKLIIFLNFALMSLILSSLAFIMTCTIFHYCPPQMVKRFMSFCR